MSEERRRILEMLAQGKISVSDAEQLLHALGEPEEPVADSAAGGEAAPRSAGSPKYLHVHVKKNTNDASGAWQGRWWARHQAHGAWAGRGAAAAADGDVQYSRDVDVRIPLSLLRSGMKLAAFMPGRTGDVVSRRLREKGLDIDMSKLDPAEFEKLLTNLGELTVDLDNGRGQVRIYCE